MNTAILTDHYTNNYKKLVKRAVWRVPHRSHALAEEVVQEAYTRATKYLNTYDPERSAFGAWFNRIYNGCVAACIKEENNHTDTSFDEWWENDGIDDVDGVAYLEGLVLNKADWVPKEMVTIIQKNIEAQKPDVAEVLHLFFNLGMKSTDIAECTNQSHANVRQIVHRFRIKWSDENIF